MTWTYKIKEGLFSTEIKLIFGADRQSLRDLLHFDNVKNKGRADSEDSYKVSFPGNWIRLNFENERLKEIEILGGTVYIDNVKISIEGELSKTIQALKDKGFVFSKSDYSYTEFQNLFDIGDSDDNGGEPNKIMWFYTATNFDHLIE